MEKATHETIQPWPGDILRIDSQGRQEKFSFDMEEPVSSLFSRSWYVPALQRHSTRSHVTQQDYIQAVKTVAIFHGFEAEEIDALLADGYTTDDLEDMIYCRRL